LFAGDFVYALDIVFIVFSLEDKAFNLLVFAVFEGISNGISSLEYQLASRLGPRSLASWLLGLLMMEYVSKEFRMYVFFSCQTSIRWGVAELVMCYSVGSVCILKHA
jgi:hypothetical protein